MLGSKNRIIHISKTLISVGYVDAKTGSIAIEKTYPYSPGALQQIFSDIKKTFGSKLGCIISDDFVYLKILNVPKDSPVNDESVISQAKEYIPDDIEKQSLDYIRIFRITQPTTEDIDVIQMASLTKHICHEISSALHQTGLRFAYIEPESVALTHLTQDVKVPHVLAYQAESYGLLCYIYENFVIHVETCQTITQKELDTILMSVKNEPYADPQNIITNLQQPSFTTQIPIESRLLHPLIGRSHMTKDEDALNLNISNSGGGVSLGSIFKNILFLAVALGIVYGGYYLYQTRATTIKDETEVQPTAVPTDIPQPTIAYSDVSIELLNGNGIRGATSGIQTTLESLGYDNLSVSNADNYDYTDTIIQAKKKIPSSQLSIIENLLESDYSVSIGETLEDDAESDISIIIGLPTEQ